MAGPAQLRQRIRCAALIVDCARRETFEGIALAIEPGRLLFVRELIDLALRDRNLELFCDCPRFLGTATTADLVRPGRLDARSIEASRFVPRGELDKLTVDPPELKEELWRDLAEGFPETRYLGLQPALPGVQEVD